MFKVMEQNITQHIPNSTLIAPSFKGFYNDHTLRKIADD